MADVMISYAREDSDFTRALQDALEKNGRTTWVDWQDIPPSAPVRQEIFEAIADAAAVIIVLSPDWAASNYCRQEFDQAQNSLRSAEARLQALNAQVNEQRVELEYYRVVAPQAGVVGDISIRTGDRVTKSTMILTIDDNRSLEAYIQVPIDRSPDLRVGLPVQILDADGNVLATNPITFVAPRVDDATQTVLVKSALREVPATVRTLQFVRSRIVWRSDDGLTIPITAVTRISGKYFCYVVGKGDGGTVARQRPVEVGELQGNDYVVISGVAAGDQLIVSGIQKLADGVPVKVQ